MLLPALDLFRLCGVWHPFVLCFAVEKEALPAACAEPLPKP